MDRVDRYDVIVVGAGAAGAVVAARWARDPTCRVLVLEAGDDLDADGRLPAGLRRATDVRVARPGHPHAWPWTAEVAPQREVPAPRGRLVGGSLAVNAGYYLRPRPEDLAAWAEVVGDDPLWSPDAWVATAARLDSVRADAAASSSATTAAVPTEITGPSHQHPAARAFVAGAVELGGIAVADLDQPGPGGVGPVRRNTRDGRRVTTAETHLAPARARHNLEVRARAEVRRIRFTGDRATGVEVVEDGIRARIDADEIVLCAGAIGSPSLLLRSGVGPPEELVALGVPVVHERRGVGRGLSDHPDVLVRYLPVTSWPTGDLPLQVAWHATSSTPLRDGGDLEILHLATSLATFLRGPAAGSGTALADEVGGGDAWALRVALQQPVSRGVVALSPLDVDGPPRTRHDALAQPRDARRLREGVRLAVAVLRSDAYGRHVGRLLDLDAATLLEDRALDAWLVAHLGTAIHACGTCRAGRADDPDAVVDGRGRVHGLRGLRVLDTSILPEVPSRGPAASAVLLAEHLAGRAD